MTAMYCTRCNLYHEGETHKHCIGVQRPLNGREADRLAKILKHVCLVRPFVIKQQSFAKFCLPSDAPPPDPVPAGYRMSHAEIARRYETAGCNYAGPLRIPA